jgi:hypothetical protein
MRWTASRRDGWHRLTTRLAGRPVYFETRDGELRPSTEGLAGLCLPPALERRRRMRFLGRPDPVWLEHVRELAQIFSGWWWPDARLDFRFWGVPSRAPVAATDRTAAFFSAGVDSFHTLLRPSQPPHAMVAVGGFDIALEDAPRLLWLETTLRELAAARGLEAVWIRTNLRQNPFFETTDWTRSHGAVLACVGHLLSDRFSHWLIPSTSPIRQPFHWGSSARTDPLWSSAHTFFHYDGGNFSRNDKVDRIGHEPDVQSRLRVCWENQPGTINCGACEKCCRTMLTFLSAGAPIPATFPPGVDLVTWLDRLSGPPYHSPLTYGELEERLSGLPELQAAMRRLRARPPWKPGDPMFRDAG